MLCLARLDPVLLQEFMDAGLGPVLIESDAYNVVNLVNNKTLPYADIGVIVKDVQNLLLSIPGSSVCFVPRSCNCAVHRLAKWSVANNGTFLWQGETPRWLLSSIEADLPLSAL
ncbi:hypothetical protein PanWU01x14_185690 [Parasponia andersonii]|uniref:RNase H type-1 domain-containing protein n=1 Tax=Parasponia andersonii TaxID=3476 RepID=A0A2P5C3U4_PARAD|nr:hypothetical protein PanWU01x14_185690 [Parasponia andersonii]